MSEQLALTRPSDGARGRRDPCRAGASTRRPASGRWQALRCNWAIGSQPGRRARERPRLPPLGGACPSLTWGLRAPMASRILLGPQAWGPPFLLQADLPLASSLSNLPAGAVPLAGGWAPDSVLETHLWGAGQGVWLSLGPDSVFPPTQRGPRPHRPQRLVSRPLEKLSAPPPGAPTPGSSTWHGPAQAISSVPRGRDHAARPATVCVVQTCPGGHLQMQSDPGEWAGCPFQMRGNWSQSTLWDQPGRGRGRGRRGEGRDIEASGQDAGQRESSGPDDQLFTWGQRDGPRPSEHPKSHSFPFPAYVPSGGKTAASCQAEGAEAGGRQPPHTWRPAPQT